MKSIDIKTLELNISLPSVLNAVSSGAFFEIDIEGNLYVNECASKDMPIVFRAQANDDSSLIMDAKAVGKQVFKDYNPIIEGSNCRIKPLVAWQHVIGLNKDRMLYFDHQSDGVELFEDKKLEDMGWEATALDISYREISEYIENSCEGTLVFYDNDIQFNGFVLVDDIKDVRAKVKTFIVEKIKLMIEADELDIDDYDIKEALKFFKVKV